MSRESRSEAPTILVVDDEEMVRASTARMLQRRGYRVVTAARADEALAWLRSEATVDLLISDIVMPEIYGTDLVELARQVRPGLPALLLSGFADQDNTSHRPIPPGVPFLHKPFDFDDLLVRVQALLGG
jgi:DNA-binding NtrC family response regulator